MNNKVDFELLESKLGYCFNDKKLLKQALTHSSYSNEMKINNYGNYERLEFLGDAVLEMTSSAYFYEAFKDMNEGQLTRLRSSLVCEQALAYCARNIELQKYILLGRGEDNSGGRERDSIISDVFEAVIGAIYLDGGIEQADIFVKKHVLTDMKNRQLFFDAKTILQEKVQFHGKVLTYELVSESGPDHEKEFKVHALVDNEIVSEGVGKTKKAAEQQAAYVVLKKDIY